MIRLFNKLSFDTSKGITVAYSTSFSLGIKTLDRSLHNPIYAIYGLVRYADEIVDTFFDHDQEDLLKRFRKDTFLAIDEKISLNPVLHSFQLTVNKYKIRRDLIEAFFDSMEMDLFQSSHKRESYESYIYGSAEVVGLMCLQVFVNGNESEFNRLSPFAKSLGAAFQKVNFLRDIKSDYEDRGRIYFPGVDFSFFDKDAKSRIEQDIQSDFDHALEGILLLPKEAKAGVYLAYKYYLKLFNKIKKTPASTIQEARIRVPNQQKLWILLRTYAAGAVNLI
ncbi:MAG: phytoene/squalene synthase family protein [Chitinophagales bacterium]|nr:phytoene/squalene synthase family protein [Chitinophagales bacterium]